MLSIKSYPRKRIIRNDSHDCLSANLYWKSHLVFEIKKNYKNIYS